MRLTRERKLAVAAVAAVVAAVGFAIVMALCVGVARSELGDRQQHGADLQFQLDRAAAVPAAAPAGESAGPQLAEQPDVAGAMQCLQDLADAAGVALDHVAATPSRSEGKQSLRITGRGAPAATCALLAAIERQPRLLVVEGGRVVAADGAALGFELTIAAWYAAGNR